MSTDAGQLGAPESTLLGLVRLRLHLDRDQLLLLFTASNLAFLALDVGIAHSINAFVPVYEWIPVFLSPFGAATAIWLAIHRRPSRIAQCVHLLCMMLGILVGVLGFAFHLRAALAPSGDTSWAWVIFSAPVLAPLSFAGVSLVGIVAMLKERPADSGMLQLLDLFTLSAPINKTQHLLWLTGLGFLGAAATSFLDHAQYGYTLFEWIPIVAGAFATFIVLGRALLPRSAHIDNVGYLWTMLLMIAVGVTGFAFHLSKDMADTGRATLERMRDFAPIFAPLLFADLAALGLLVVIESDEHTANL